MEAARAALPELDLVDHEAPAAPEAAGAARRGRRTGRRSSSDPPVEVGAVGDHRRSAATPTPRSGCRAAATAKYSSLSASARPLDRSAHAHLAVQVEPGEHAGGPRVGAELAALRAVVVGVEHERRRSSMPRTSTNRASGRPSASGGRQDHRVGLGDPGRCWRRRTSAATARSGRRRRRPTSSPAVSYWTRRAPQLVGGRSCAGSMRVDAADVRAQGRRARRPSRRPGGSSRRSPPTPAARRAPTR